MWNTGCAKLSAQRAVVIKSSILVCTSFFASSRPVGKEIKRRVIHSLRCLFQCADWFSGLTLTRTCCEVAWRTAPKQGKGRRGHAGHRTRKGWAVFFAGSTMSMPAEEHGHPHCHSMALSSRSSIFSRLAHASQAARSCADMPLVSFPFLVRALPASPVSLLCRLLLPVRWPSVRRRC